MTKNKGKFFVLDGPDGSGKTTQTELLAKHLRKLGKKVLLVDFPQYQTSFFGAMVGEYLKGTYGNVFEISPYLSSMLYALDRWSARSSIAKALKERKIVLANRFTSSNIIHQGAKIKNPIERKKYFAWVEHVEYKVLGIPRPTKVFFLDVPTRISWKLIEQRNRKGYATGSKRDEHEKSKDHLTKAYLNARAYAKAHRDWLIIPCTKGDRLLSPLEVHKKLYKQIVRIFK